MRERTYIDDGWYQAKAMTNKQLLKRKFSTPPEAKILRFSERFHVKNQIRRIMHIYIYI